MASKRYRRGRTPAAPAGSSIVALGTTGDTPPTIGGLSRPPARIQAGTDPAVLAGPFGRVHRLVGPGQHGPGTGGRSGTAQPNGHGESGPGAEPRGSNRPQQPVA